MVRRCRKSLPKPTFPIHRAPPQPAMPAPTQGTDSKQQHPKRHIVGLLRSGCCRVATAARTTTLKPSFLLSFLSRLFRHLLRRRLEPTFAPGHRLNRPKNAILFSLFGHVVGRFDGSSSAALLLLLPRHSLLQCRVFHLQFYRPSLLATPSHARATRYYRIFSRH